MPNLIVFCGWSRSGISRLTQYLMAIHGYDRVSAEEIRRLVGARRDGLDPREGHVDEVVRHRILEGLIRDRDVVVDTPAMYRRQRRLFFDLNRYRNGGIETLEARRCLISVQITRAVWRRRQRFAKRDVKLGPVWFDNYEPVTDQEVRELGVVEHLRIKNSTDEQCLANFRLLDERFGRADATPPPVDDAEAAKDRARG